MISMSDYTAWWLGVTLESDRWGSETTTQPRPILYISFLTMTPTKVAIQLKRENKKCITQHRKHLKSPAAAVTIYHHPNAIYYII